MQFNLEQELVTLRRMTARELRQRYAQFIRRSLALVPQSVSDSQDRVALASPIRRNGVSGGGDDRVEIDRPQLASVRPTESNFRKPLLGIAPTWLRSPERVTGCKVSPRLILSRRSSRFFLLTVNRATDSLIHVLQL